jgi:transcriptional regulator with XRE-family HTH domain
MDYGSRLSKAMKDAGVQRKDLARELGVTVHAIGMVITAAGGKERWLSRENHLKAAEFLKVDPNWLMTGNEQPLNVPIAMQANAPQFSPTAMELAWLFDQIPVDERLKRVVAYNAATQQILNVLQELSVAPANAAPLAAAAAKTHNLKTP